MLVKSKTLDRPPSKDSWDGLSKFNISRKKANACLSKLFLSMDLFIDMVCDEDVRLLL